MTMHFSSPIWSQRGTGLRSRGLLEQDSEETSSPTAITSLDTATETRYRRSSFPRDRSPVPLFLSPRSKKERIGNAKDSRMGLVLCHSLVLGLAVLALATVPS